MLKKTIQKLTKQPFYVTLPIAMLVIAATWTTPYALQKTLDSALYVLLAAQF